MALLADQNGALPPGVEPAANTRAQLVTPSASRVPGGKVSRADLRLHKSRQFDVNSRGVVAPSATRPRLSSPLARVTSAQGPPARDSSQPPQLFGAVESAAMPATTQRVRRLSGQSAASAMRGRFRAKGVVSATLAASPKAACESSSWSGRSNAAPAAGSNRSIGRAPLREQTSERLETAEEEMQSTYARTWWGKFVSREDEVEYRLGAWHSMSGPRHSGVAFFSIIAVLHALSAGSVIFRDSRPMDRFQEQLPSGIMTLLGVCILSLGWRSNARVIRHWDALAAAALVLVMLPIVAIYPFFLCHITTEDGEPQYASCSALQSNFLPWGQGIALIMLAVAAPSNLHLGWLPSLCVVLGMVILSLAAFASHTNLTNMLQYGAGMLMSVYVTTHAARNREMAERAYWASVRSFARAQLLQERAEKLGSEDARRRQAAEERTENAQTVMRYVCHELRNPLHGIMGLLEGVKGELDELEPWVAEDVDTVWNAATSMAVILNDVLDLGQLQRGQMSLNPVPTDCVGLIDSCVMTLQGVASVPILSHIAASLPGKLNLDPLRISQIMTNGVSNAAKLTKQGKVELVAQLRDGNFWFEVFDTGCGLSGDAGHLFQPYAQDKGGTARRTRTRFERGTGLGLAISAQLVRLMGGDIGLENRSDGVQGARFWFWVPVAPGIAAAGSSGASAHGELTTGVSWGGSTGSVRSQQGEDAGSDGERSEFMIHQEQRRSRRTPGVADRSGLDWVVHDPTSPSGLPLDEDAQTYKVRVLPASRHPSHQGSANSIDESERSVGWAMRTAHNSMAMDSKEATQCVTSSHRGAFSHSVLSSSPAHGNVTYRDHREYNTTVHRGQRTNTNPAPSTLSAAQRRQDSVVVHMDDDGVASGTPHEAARVNHPAADVDVPGVANATSPSLPLSSPSSRPRLPTAGGLVVDAADEVAPATRPNGEQAQRTTSAGVIARGGPLTPLGGHAVRPLPEGNGRLGAVVLGGAGSAAALHLSGGRVSGVSLDPPEEMERKVAPATPGSTGTHNRGRSDCSAATDDAAYGSQPPSGSRRRKRKAKPSGPLPFAGVHVLVCDDERVNRTVLKRYCTKVGCSVRAMEDADELLLLLADPDNRTADGLHLVDPATARRFDLIFLDIMMQRSNGEEVCQQLRAAGIKTPVVAATGNGVKEDLDRYSGAGFSSVLLKPFSSTTVTGVVRALVPCTAPVMSDATGTMTPPA